MMNPNKIKIMKTIILIIALLIPFHVHSSNNKNRFEITVSNQDQTATPSSDMVQLTMYEFFSHFGFIINSQVVKLSIGYKQKQSWNTEMPSEIAYLNIGYRKSGLAQNFLKYRYVFPIYTSDSIHCEVYGDSVRFYGRGSEKMNVQAKLFAILETQKPAGVSFDQFLQNRIGIYRQQLDFLEGKKTVLSTAEFNLLKDQCYGLRNWDILKELRIRLNFRKNDLSFDKDRIIEWLSQEDARSIKSHSIVSPYLMDYLYQKEKFTTEFLVNAEKLPGTLMDNITKKFEGRSEYHLKMLMLTGFFTRDKDVLKEFVKSTPVVHDQQYAKIFQHFLTSLSSQADAYNFELPDINGKILRLSDFKGKVVVLDFWFTGCIPCLELAKQMKIIGEELRGLNVVFITANADSKAEYWKASVATGQYTHSNSIDLYMGGTKSAMLKHYNISAFPRLIVIGKSGKIITSTPKEPFDENSRRDFVSLIKQAL